tara:strand:- start:404 stop:658 length:255 start_codon:yes stop_codon:yes gene_type:complete
MVLLYYTLLRVISYMKKRDILIVVLGVALLVSVIWMMQGDEIKEKVAESAKEAAKEAVVDKVVDEVSNKAKEKLKEEVLDKLLP